MAGGADLAFQDLAIVLVVAGFTTFLFWKLRQPVVLGYLLAGFLVGPHSVGPSVGSPETLKFLGELGIVFLLFALGLEFNLRKLRRVGASALAAGVLEISVMIALGYAIGKAMGWAPLESLFLGAVISISSTTIIFKVLHERGGKDESWAQLAFGILLVEDVVAILLLTILSSAGVSGGFDPGLLGDLGIRLVVFLGTALVLGLLIMPRIVDALVRMNVEEVIVVAGVGIGFGIALLAAWLEFSAGLGAFIAGALMAESPRVHRIGEKIVPLRDLFTGVFFVTVGAAIVPADVVANAGMIGIVVLAVVVGKLFGVSFGAFVTGRPTTESMRVGMTLTQIGEFSFVIATLGVTIGAARPEIYAIAVATSAITAFTTPYFIGASGRIAERVHESLPSGIRAFAANYGAWIARVGRTDKQDPEWRAAKRAVVRVVLFSVASLGILVGGGVFFDELANAIAAAYPPIGSASVSLGWTLVIFALAPFVYLWTVHVRRLVKSLARLAVPARLRGAGETGTERLLRRAFGTVAVVLFGGAVLALGMPLLGSPLVLVAVVASIGTSAAFFGRSLRQFHLEVESTVDRLMDDEGGSKAEALNLLESAAAWGAESRVVRLDPSCAGSGRRISELRLRQLTGATIVSVRREEAHLANPDPNFELRQADEVLLVGDEPALLRAEEILRGIDLGVEGGVTYVLVEAASPLVGLDFADPAFRQRIRADVLRVRRGNRSMALSEAVAIEAGDVLVAFGTEAEVKGLQMEAKATARAEDR